MPCYDPHPTDRDQKAMEALGYIRTYCKKFNQPFPHRWSHYGTDSRDSCGAENHLDEMTAWLCTQLRARPDDEKEAVFGTKNPNVLRLEAWWLEHQEFDRKRGS